MWTDAFDDKTILFRCGDQVEMKEMRSEIFLHCFLRWLFQPLTIEMPADSREHQLFDK